MPTTAGFPGLLRSEWTKLRSVRSYRWTFLALVGCSLAIGALVSALEASHWAHASAAARANFDPTNWTLAGLAFGQLAVGALGALAMSSEHSTGTITGSLAAVPHRSRLLAAKATVVGGVVLVAGEALTFMLFAIGQAILAANHAPHVSLGQPGVLRAVALSGAFLALLSLFGLGIGTVVRHSAGAVTLYVGLVLVLPLILFPFHVARFAPETLLSSSVGAVRPAAQALPPGWVGFGLMALYAAGALALGTVAFVRRDA